jgi:dUTP pyrophosphatase
MKHLFMYNRSGNPIKKLIMLANGVGVVDSDYYGNESNDGAIMFQFWNFGIKPIHIVKGERIGQGVFKKFLLVDDDTTPKKKRKGGHGSTGSTDS